MENLITLELLQEYADTMDKLILCSDTLELSIDNPKVEQFEDMIIAKCNELNIKIYQNGKING
jgi:hypothetical protein